jgi:uncharacterized protein with von Willebrand factor type A (vWA) domain
MIESIIDSFVENPSEEIKQQYMNHVLKAEQKLLEESITFAYKSREYFDKRIEAFSYRRECAKKMINKWIAKYQTSSGCCVSYADTLNIPFQQIKL